MNSRITTAGMLAKNNGCKIIVYGAPGAGKTPLATTADNVLLVSTEGGLISLGAACDIPTWDATTISSIVDFFGVPGIANGWIHSAEAKNYDTIMIDSITALANIVLDDEMRREAHGMKAYGQMSDRVYGYASMLFFKKGVNIVATCHQSTIENGRQSVIDGGKIRFDPVMQKRPHLPGKALGVSLPHLFDCVLHLDRVNMEGRSDPVQALRTREIPEVFARNRLGLRELEPANLQAIFSKMAAGEPKND